MALLKIISIVEDFCSICDEHVRVMAVPREGYFCKKCIDKAFKGQSENEDTDDGQD